MNWFVFVGLFAVIEIVLLSVWLLSNTFKTVEEKAMIKASRAIDLQIEHAVQRLKDAGHPMDYLVIKELKKAARYANRNVR